MREVYDYDSGRSLEGTPSEELVERSDEAEPTGAVPAYRDSEGVWQYVAPSQVELYQRQRGEDVRTVYVQ